MVGGLLYRFPFPGARYSVCTRDLENRHTLEPPFSNLTYHLEKGDHQTFKQKHGCVLRVGKHIKYSQKFRSPDMGVFWRKKGEHLS
jgi:hypothetical protein